MTEKAAGGKTPGVTSQHGFRRRVGRGWLQRHWERGEAAVKYACPRCGRVHEKRMACVPPGRRHPVQDSAARRLRATAAWRKVKRMANERDGYLCVLCLQEGRLTWDGLETHHIVPIERAPELALDLDNLVTLCRRHHEEVEKHPPGVPGAFWEGLRDRRRTREQEIFRKPGI